MIPFDTLRVRRMRASPAFARAVSRAADLEPLLYAVWAAVWTLASGRRFYGYMMKQTGGEWSAPLDDVFIHFDYARATAEGHPFEWVSGNGFSSGNTSISYPFVLAAGYLAGFKGGHLMLWAAVVAATSVFGALLAARMLFTRTKPGGEGAPVSFADRFAAYLVPPLFLGIGALDWTLWSGMEVAFFLATWGLGVVAYLVVVEHDEPARPYVGSVPLGVAGALLILTRPEAITTVFAFGAGAIIHRRKTLTLRRASGVALRMFAPGAVVVVGQALCNRAFTGEWTANGALVKLAVYNPFLSREAKWEDYVFNFKYEIFRNLEYHFTDAPALGVILPALGAAALAVRRTRATALLLWAQVLGWAALVALNGQVRWQNERYTMPAVAWLTVVAALGASALVRKRGRPTPALSLALGIMLVQAVISSRLPAARPEPFLGWMTSVAAGVVLAGLLALRPVRVLAVLAALALFHEHQVTKMRDQKWFFGRACRNIRDQHFQTGWWLSKVKPRRVLVGDAGAIIYASERPGLDIIGLGGFHELPFARAGVQGLAATLELMERVPPEDLPDLMAIYPSWWGILPTWFGKGVVARMPAVGNVICGGYEDVVYVTDWHLLGTGEMARNVPAGASVIDEVDVADLVSEREHRYTFQAPVSGFTELRVLADPSDALRDLLDGGRELKPGTSESMRMGAVTPGREAALIFRTAQVAPTSILFHVDGQALPAVPFDRHDGWLESVVRIDGQLLHRTTVELTVTNEGANDWVDYHVWLAQ